MDLVLVAPDERYETSFTDMVKDFYTHGELEKYASFQSALEHFDSYVAARRNEADGIDLPEGYVPMFTYWLTDETDTVYGTIRYRPVLTAALERAGGHIGFDIAPAHRGKGYGTTMLRLLLYSIAPRPQEPLLLTCDAGNIASQKVIENNGGLREPSGTGDDGTVLRYRIRLS